MLLLATTQLSRLSTAYLQQSQGRTADMLLRLGTYGENTKKLPRLPQSTDWANVGAQSCRPWTSSASEGAGAG